VYCTKCGTANDENATTCIQCGNALRPPAYGSPATPPPPPQAPPPPQYQQAPIAQAYTPPPPMAAGIPGTPPAVVPNYLVQAILVTFCCCLPLGIASIIFASQVNTKLAVGDVAGAMESSRQAKLFAWIGFGLGAGGIVIYCVLMFLGVAASIIGNHAH
jgi:hypothetical protein